MVAIDDDTVLTETGEIITLDTLTTQIFTLPPTLFASMGAADLLARLDTVFAASHPTTWQWRISDSKRQLHRPNAPRRVTRVAVAVHYFGFKGGNYHKLIDPVTMYGRGLPQVWPGADDLLVKLLQWTITLRDFCDENNIDVRPTMGSIGAQFLTDSRFYPNARRKVPTKTNEVSREHLPGNHYCLAVTAKPGRTYTALYLDQHRAHHHHAQTTHFPAGNHLYAYGYFRTLDRIYRDANSYRNTFGTRFYGLYCLDLLPPAHGRAFSWLKRNALERAFVYSNELGHLLDLGYKVKGVRAAWGSHHRDTGIGQYARFACEQLDHYNNAAWLKPILLSTYGTLACKPTHAEAIFRLAKRGTETVTLTGKRSLTGKLVKRAIKLEPGIVNVIQRGMIEAATRSDSIGLAQWLNHSNQRILAIYADAVIVEADDDLPLPTLPEPWRLKKQLTHYQPITAQAFTSDGMTRLPGVTRELRQITIRGHAPRPANVAELMELEELSNTLITTKGT